jgi:hypothetical protein
MQISASVLNFLERHYAVYGRCARNVVFLADSGLNPLLSTPNVEKIRPVGLQI